MPQLNIHLTPEMQDNLRDLMRLRRMATKSEAVRAAVREAVERERAACHSADFRSWLGLANQAPHNPDPRFSSDDDLWR